MSSLTKKDDLINYFVNIIINYDSDLFAIPELRKRINDELSISDNNQIKEHLTSLESMFQHHRCKHSTSVKVKTCQNSSIVSSMKRILKALLLINEGEIILTRLLQ